ncbi:MAG: response regulator [Nitrospiraceae bacterium]|nr:response regulator [Nitrospiraceae bacterium]
MNILIVDDEQLVRWFLERALTRWGHKVISVSSGKEALSALGGGEFDLMFTDLRMPEEDGSTLISRLGEITDRKVPKVVICSAYVTQELAEKYKGEGIMVLRKPFRLEELEKILSGVS